MGLDITAYKGLKKLDVLFDKHGEPVDPATRESIGDFLKIYENPDFPGRIDDLEDRAVYAYEEADEAFCSSYGGYNRWRNNLAKLAGYPLTDYQQHGQTYQSHAAACWAGATGPFSELINFADNEGVIGPVTCAKLLQDFIAFEDKAKAVTADEFFYRTYQQMRRGLELAAQGGCLDFH